MVHTFKISYQDYRGFVHTVTTKDFDSFAAQMYVIIYHNAKQILSVTQVN